MSKETQVSAHISQATRELMEKYVRRTGVKKGHLIEQALLHHLQALDEIPAEYIMHPRVAVSRETFEEMMKQAEEAVPTAALRELMQSGD
ncbi:MAG: hypothetical protein KIT72_16155 [Polyangiaceae bacterium]|nr:hypothetical protein [Polyangiaceae bacterium]MCW5791951.1 hypothetical protein [Polyangiaceae bacterium]